jgi:hypothetical protein
MSCIPVSLRRRWESRCPEISACLGNYFSSFDEFLQTQTFAVDFVEVGDEDAVAVVCERGRDEVVWSWLPKRQRREGRGGEHDGEDQDEHDM